MPKDSTTKLKISVLPYGLHQWKVLAAKGPAKPRPIGLIKKVHISAPQNTNIYKAFNLRNGYLGQGYTLKAAMKVYEGLTI